MVVGEIVQGLFPSINLSTSLPTSIVLNLSSGTTDGPKDVTIGSSVVQTDPGYGFILGGDGHDNISSDISTVTTMMSTTDMSTYNELEFIADCLLNGSDCNFTFMNITTGNDTNVTDVSGYVLPLPMWTTILFGVLTGAGSIMTILGNIMVILSFFIERSLRQPTNYFIASLAVSDLLIGAFSMPLLSTYLLLGYWPLGPWICDLWLSLDWTVCLASQYTVFSITADRFCSVKIPAKYRNWRSDRKIRIIIGIIWVIPAAIFFTSIIGWQYFAGGRSIGDQECEVQFMSSPLFMLILTVIYFWVTLIIMIGLYSGIYKVALDLQRKSDAKHRKMNSTIGMMCDQLRIGITMTRTPMQTLPAVAEKDTPHNANNGHPVTNSTTTTGVLTTSFTAPKPTSEKDEDRSSSPIYPSDEDNSSQSSSVMRKQASHRHSKLGKNKRKNGEAHDCDETKKLVPPGRGNHMSNKSIPPTLSEIHSKIVTFEDDNENELVDERTRLTVSESVVDKDCNTQQQQTPDCLIPKVPQQKQQQQRKQQQQQQQQQEKQQQQQQQQKQQQQQQQQIAACDENTNVIPIAPLTTISPEKVPAVYLLPNDVSRGTKFIDRDSLHAFMTSEDIKLIDDPEDYPYEYTAIPIEEDMNSSPVWKRRISIPKITAPLPPSPEPVTERLSPPPPSPLSNTMPTLLPNTPTADLGSSVAELSMIDRPSTSSESARGVSLASVQVDTIDTNSTTVTKLVKPRDGIPLSPSTGGVGGENLQRNPSKRSRIGSPFKSLVKTVSSKNKKRRSRRGSKNKMPTKSKSENRARKALRTITFILGAFVVCWTPYHIVVLVQSFCPSCNIAQVYSMAYWLCYLNSPINPFCYAFANAQFKRTFLRILRLDWHRS